MLFAVLLVPFLGLLWNAIPDKKWKTILVISLVAIASLPSVVNAYKFRCPGWWSQPSINTDYVKLIPDQWSGLYPITYYFIGCYLSEFQLRINVNNYYGYYFWDLFLLEIL